MNKFGQFVIFEGLPGSGKTTVTRKIARDYKGFRIGEQIAPDFREVLVQDLKNPDVQFFLESDKRKYSLAESLEAQPRQRGRFLQ